MRALLVLFAVFFSFTSVAASPESLKKCRIIDQLPDANLEEIARGANTTVQNLRAACRELQLEERQRRSMPRRPPVPPRGRVRNPVPAPKPPRSEPVQQCACGNGEVCVQEYLQWKCVFYRDSTNRCSNSGECGLPGSNCVNGACTN